MVPCRFNFVACKYIWRVQCMHADKFGNLIARVIGQARAR